MDTLLPTLFTENGVILLWLYLYFVLRQRRRKNERILFLLQSRQNRSKWKDTTIYTVGENEREMAF